MTKLSTARVLMVATILLIAAFQAYWINKLYKEEDNNFQKSADIIFRESMYRLQVERFKGDSMFFKRMRGDNLFMADVVSNVKRDIKLTADSVQQRFLITVQTDAVLMKDNKTDSNRRDTIIFIKRGDPALNLPHINRFLDSNKLLNDTIPLNRIDSMYASLLKKEGINVPYRIYKTGGPGADSSSSNFITKNVPVGLLHPVFYQAGFASQKMYVLKKIEVQLFLSIVLIVLTTLSFVFIYRSLLAQKKLTQIKNDFIGNITHELKTPIATVTVAIEALQNFGGLQSPERTREYLDISALELQRLSLLVDKVLKLSMFENKEISLQRESFNLLHMIEQVLSSMKLQFEKANANVSLESVGSNFIIDADPLHMSSVIYNLLDNALKYIKGVPEISIQLLDRRNHLELRVQDNGIGISKEYQQKIFEQFFRVPSGNTHNTKGYGLGLSYVSHIVRCHQGFIEVKSELNKGSEFIIKIPFTEAPTI
jgi:two-component system, OmpR family, phosphate regulon sensor histidine kinase PhoR